MENAKTAYILSKVIDGLTDAGTSVNLHGIDYEEFKSLESDGWEVESNVLGERDYYTAKKGSCTLFSTFRAKEKELTELTIDEIADKFGLSVSDVRIKD